jgi:hypothetical protein
LVAGKDEFLAHFTVKAFNRKERREKPQVRKENYRTNSNGALPNDQHPSLKKCAKIGPYTHVQP